MKRSALFLSPHLDDVAFSCGGILIRLVEEGWDVRLCTVFTASIPEPKGFALACQLDKGLAADVDYMALRREEDREFANRAGLHECLHLGFPEAPHRGYYSAADLFSGLREDDRVCEDLARALQTLTRDDDALFAPQGLGRHVDHLQTVAAVVRAGWSDSCYWYRDTPYAIRNPSASPSPQLPADLTEIELAIDVARKAAACEAYQTQVPFQFGGIGEMRAKLETFHRTAAGYGEILLRSTDSNRSPSQSRIITRES